jgi:carboxyl-terminal processing protease
VSRYDDPGWYEEQHPYPSFPQQPAHTDSNSRSVTNNGDYFQQPPPLMTDRDDRVRRMFGQLLVVIALLVIAFLGGWFSHQFFGDSFNQSDKSKTYEQLFQQAWTTIDQNYVDRKAIDYQKMSYAAIQAMADSLHDKGHTRFLTPADVQTENQQLSGTFTGVGLYLRQDKTTKQLIITSPIPGSPAERAGFKHGDIIIAVNGTSTAGKDIAAVSGLIQGKVGTSVAITIQRSGVAQPITIHVNRAEIKVPNVIMHYIAEDHIAHIQIAQFAEGVSGQLKDALTQAKKMGATRIILDLRNDPGGYLNEAINTASDFIKSGNVLLEEDSTGHRTPVAVTGNPIDMSDSIVVLINSNTASAAEIVTGALKDNHRATVIGDPATFGTGTVLQEFPLADGSAMLLGTQEWLTPNGQFIRDKGITPSKPDLVVKLGSNAFPLTPTDENAGKMTEQQILASGDAQLVKAINYLKGSK